MTEVPEAQLQAYCLAALRQAFPHVPSRSFELEKHLKVRLGRSEYHRDGAMHWDAHGRADLVIRYEGRPLAVLELKRADQTLDDEDVEQARSYAIAMLDQPPLVVISNGSTTWVRQTADGKELDAGVRGASMIKAIFENAATLAGSNMEWVIETLLGPRSAVWAEVVRRRTDELVGRLTGDAEDTRRPFPRDLLLWRRATGEVVRRLSGGAKAMVLDGPPLIGKSNVLRHLAVATRASENWAVLLVGASSHGPGLFQRIANLMGAALEWNLSADDVRTWLRRMSRSSSGPALVLAVDGLLAGSAVASDVEELAESGFGGGLRMVVTTDRADRVRLDARGRNETAFGSISEEIGIGPIDDIEFQKAREDAAEAGVLFYGGAELSREYRIAWMLRGVLAGVPMPSQEDHAAVLPATMGLKIMRDARRRLREQEEVARLHRLLARDALAEAVPVSEALALARAGAFLVRRDALSAEGERAARELADRGWVDLRRHAGGEDVVVCRAPEFLMSELARELSVAVETALGTDADGAAALLIVQARGLPFGDLVGAQALVDLAERRGALPFDLVAALMDDAPTTEGLTDRTVAFEIAGEVVRMHFDERGQFAVVDAGGRPLGPYQPAAEFGDAPSMHGDATSWMMLSQLARLRTAFGTPTDRFDFEIMLHVGRCAFPLIRSSPDITMPHETQSLGSHGSVLTARCALAEPITAAMHKLFAEEWINLGAFLDRVVEAGSLPLTARVHNALANLRTSSDERLKAWVESTLKEVVHPLLARQMRPPADVGDG